MNLSVSIIQYICDYWNIKVAMSENAIKDDMYFLLRVELFSPN